MHLRAISGVAIVVFGCGAPRGDRPRVAGARSTDPAPSTSTAAPAASAIATTGDAAPRDGANAPRDGAMATSPTPTPAPSRPVTAAKVATTPGAIPLPPEPWYRDHTDFRRDECVAPLTAPPTPHFPPPFATCDPRAESWASPPGGNELHFHYRFFSAQLTTDRRAVAPDVCCYMIYEFPPRG